MAELVVVLKNRYVDSVMLMNTSANILSMEGVQAAEIVQGSELNLELLENEGFTVETGIGKNDLVIAIRADSKEACQSVCAMAAEMIDHPGKQNGQTYFDQDEIDLHQNPFNLVQISLPGQYAVAEIKKSIRNGLDVFVFSDNVSLEDELSVKRLGQENNVLVMGPDCGVGLICGVTLAAGSIVEQGPVGIVGASGSGAQEVACLIERFGSGVTEIIGTGGRDLKKQINGITMRMGMKRLLADSHTKVICLVSKLADEDVMDSVLTEADAISKPVVAVFLGADPALYTNHRVHGAASLTEAAILSVQLATGKRPQLGGFEAMPTRTVQDRVAALAPRRKYFRGLYCGGTFAEEAMICFSERLPGVVFHSNLQTKYTKTLENHRISIGHAILDLGAEDFTADAPHPVFDPTLRLKRLRQELSDPEAAVILLDFITGPGVHQNPILPFAEVCRNHPDVIFIAVICGGKNDPQNITDAKRALEESGVIVAESNYVSALLAADIITRLEGR